jgi:hypothetical protein
MDVNLEVLKYITETAVTAHGISEYQTSPVERQVRNADGSVSAIKYSPPPQKNLLADLDSVVATYARYEKEGAEVFVNSQRIVVTHDRNRINGYSTCDVTYTDAVNKIIDLSGKDMSPEAFEKVAKLYFGADLSFLTTLRNLKWVEKEDRTTQLSTVSKSADVQAIAKVVTDENILYQDIFLVVNTPVYVLPHETKTRAIELQIWADPTKKAIVFSPKPMVVLKAVDESVKEIIDVLSRILPKGTPVVFGQPIMKKE